MIMIKEIIYYTDYVNRPSWSSSFEEIGIQITECLNIYKNNGKMVKSILITVEKPSEVIWYKV